MQNPGRPNESMANAAAVLAPWAAVSDPWTNTRSMRGRARINIPTEEGMMMASIPRMPKARRWRNPVVSRSAQRVARDGVTALISEEGGTLDAGGGGGEG